MKKKSIIILFILTLFIIVLTGCNKVDIYDINIIFTSDVHCAIDENIGYSSIKAYKDMLSKTNKYVTLVDTGDAIQGNIVGSISKGEYIINIMNKAGYDLYTIGNHDFDYGIDALSNVINKFNGQVLSCNLSYIGENEDKFSKVKPYSIKEYGNTKVGYIGITTPETFVSSNPSTFIEDGKLAYSLSSDTKESFYKCVQDNINECKNLGCKYIILLSHLGYGSEYIDYGSIDLLKNISGVDAVLDGHSHKDIPCSYMKDKDNKNVPICTAGTKLKEFGRLTITSFGNILIEFINSYDEKDTELSLYIDSINNELSQIANKIVAKSDIELKITDASGTRITRNQETAIGNLIADSYRLQTGADIGIVNGGGIRSNIPSGDLTYQQIQAVNPFGNTIVIVEAKGSEIRDFLEFASRYTEFNYKDENGQPLGECGAFAQVSGLKYTIDTSISSSVTIDSIGNFLDITGTRRVKDIKVLSGNEYIDLDLEKTYTIASHNYLLLEGGDGATMFKDNNVLNNNVSKDYEVLIAYIMDYLGGNLSDKYANTDGRISII